MSFLPQEGDNVMTLHDAFALIEPSDDINRDSATFPPLEEIDELFGSMMEYSPEVAKSHEKKKAQKPTMKTAKKTKEKKKRVRSAASSSTVLQRRKKAEIWSLREQATELQKVVNQLSSSDENSGILKLNAKTYADAKVRGENMSQWQRCAVEQYEMRNNSQKVNRQLKRILSQQWNTSESLRKILQRQSLVHDTNYLMKLESPGRLHRSLADDDIRRCMAQLESAVENMYLHSNPPFEVTSATSPSSINTMETSYKEQRKGDVVEFVVSTPMTCSMAGASDVIWNYLKKVQTPGSIPNTLHMMIPWVVTHLEETFEFEKLHYIRKFSEPEKITLVCSDILLLRSKGLKLCSKGYTTITPLPADPLRTCVVRSVLQLRVDNTSDHVFAKDVALGALSKAIRLFWQSEQARLADEAVRVSGESAGSARDVMYM